jgi:hypothetical protein
MGGWGAQRPVGHGNESKKTGARSARARTRGQNPLVLHKGFVLQIRIPVGRYWYKIYRYFSRKVSWKVQVMVVRVSTSSVVDPDLHGSTLILFILLLDPDPHGNQWGSAILVPGYI